MARKAAQNRLSTKGNVTTLEQQVVIDDNLLPSADELAKLNMISKDILPWIMERTTKEQEARLTFNRNTQEIVRKRDSQFYRYNLIALFLAFFLVVLFLGASFYLIINGFPVVGTILGGGTIAMIVKYFLGVDKNKTNK